MTTPSELHQPTLPLPISEANSWLGFTLATLTSALTNSEIAFLRKAMQLYGDIRVNEAQHTCSTCGGGCFR
jgi:hypothetical protein